MSQHLNTEHSYSVMKKKVGKVNYVILRLLEIMTNLLLTSLEDFPLSILEGIEPLSFSALSKPAE